MFEIDVVEDGEEAILTLRFAPGESSIAEMVLKAAALCIKTEEQAHEWAELWRRATGRRPDLHDVQLFDWEGDLREVGLDTEEVESTRVPVGWFDFGGGA